MAEKFTSQLKKILFHPKKFFDSVEKDKDYSKIMFFYVNMAIVAAIVSFICSLILLSVQNKLASGIVNAITSGIVNIGLAFILPFVASFIVQIGVWIFRGKQGYFNTYKATTYALTITLVYGILSTLIVSIISISNPISISQEQLTTNPELVFQEPGFIASMIVAFAILFISMIHSLVVQVIGIAKFQKITKLRAFFAIIIIPLILIILTLIVISYTITRLLTTAI